MIAMQERYAPSRPYRLGTRPRRSPKGSRNDAAGGLALARRRAPSLDTDNHLATTVAMWLKEQETEGDRYENRYRLWRQLCATVYGIWQEFVAEIHSAPSDGAEWRWWNAYEAEREAVKEDRNPAYDAWLAEYVKKHGLPAAQSEAYLRTLYMERWKKQNRPDGLCARALGWEKQYFQLLHCQGEWIAMGASCCSSTTKPVAVPIGCNHRLCPLCNWHRSQNAQRKIRKLFDRINHPVFITLTVPNVKRISKRTFEFFRKRVRLFLAQHAYMLDEPGRPGGGVYAIETTYNRKEKSWHVHAHILLSANFKLPRADERIDFAGRNMRAFDYVKLVLEFDWSRIWCKDFARRWSWAPRAFSEYSELGRRNREVLRFGRSCQNERFGFEQWVRGCEENALKEWNPETRKRDKPIARPFADADARRGPNGISRIGVCSGLSQLMTATAQ